MLVKSILTGFALRRFEGRNLILFRMSMCNSSVGSGPFRLLPLSPRQVHLLRDLGFCFDPHVECEPAHRTPTADPAHGVFVYELDILLKLNESRSVGPSKLNVQAEEVADVGFARKCSSTIHDHHTSLLQHVFHQLWIVHRLMLQEGRKHGAVCVLRRDCCTC